jgi:hypothetical protein
MSMKNSKDTIKNRTRNFTACGALPKPTVPPHAPKKVSLTKPEKQVKNLK